MRLRLVLIALAIASGRCGDEPGAVTVDSQTSTGAEAPDVPPTSPKPPPPPPLPEPVEGTALLPVRVPYAVIAELVDAQLPAHQSEGYQQMTRRGSSPAIEARYDVWRDPVTVRFSDDTLHVEVPLRYAARFNARMKNPFGGAWMTVARDEPWGTEQDPLRVTVTLHSRIEISPDWQLSVRTTMDPPVHGPPPAGKLCTGGAFKLCVKKASIAPDVQRQMDAQLKARLGRAIAEFDRQAPRSVALREHVERIYRDLVQPQPTDHGRWMTLEPKAAGLALRGEDSAIQVVPALHARLTYHEDKPDFTPPPLPDRSPAAAFPPDLLELPEAFIPAELQRLRELDPG